LADNEGLRPAALRQSGRKIEQEAVAAVLGSHAPLIDQAGKLGGRQRR
jgi:hypothetical protein